jgi:hypothetical protein
MKNKSTIECMSVKCRHNLYTDCNLKIIVIGDNGECTDYSPPKTNNPVEFARRLRRKNHDSSIGGNV